MFYRTEVNEALHYIKGFYVEALEDCQIALCGELLEPVAFRASPLAEPVCEKCKALYEADDKLSRRISRMFATEGRQPH